MNLLIIGASGFIGKSIYKKAKDRGHNVFGTKFSNSDTDFISFDIMTDDIDTVVPIRFFDPNCACVVICSAVPKIDKCYLEREKSYDINVTKTIALIESLKNRNIKVVFLTTDAVYDGTEGYYDELSQLNPLNQYGMQKREVEKYISSKENNDLIVRMGIVVGDDNNSSHLFSDWYKKMSDSQPIECIKGQIFSPTYVCDVADSILSLVEGDFRGVYNITNPEYFERIELARQFLRILGSDNIALEKDLSEFGFVEERALKTYLDSSKLRKAVNINFTSMKELIKIFAANLNISSL